MRDNIATVVARLFERNAKYMINQTIRQVQQLVFVDGNHNLWFYHHSHLRVFFKFKTCHEEASSMCVTCLGTCVILVFLQLMGIDGGVEQVEWCVFSSWLEVWVHIPPK